MQKLLKRGLIAVLCILLFWATIHLQNYNLQINLTKIKSITAPPFLKKHLDTKTMSFNITFFTSKKLQDEINIKQLIRWVKSISPIIKIQIFDTFKSPEKVDHYDITNDGFIVIEHNNQRFDIDIVEKMIINKEYFLNSIKTDISKALIRLSSAKQLKTLLIHSNNTSLLSNNNPNGLSILKSIFDRNFIDIQEQSTNSNISIPTPYDLFILYKIFPMESKNTISLSRIINSETPTIVFNHPKLSSVTNSLMSFSSTQFNSFIIEDSQNTLMNSKNQLIVPYTSKSNDNLIGVFPFSGTIDFDTTANIIITASSNDSFVFLNQQKIKGPFAIIIKEPNKTWVNNFLIPTNYWITQGDNQQIIEDIINYHFNDFPITTSITNKNKSVILTWLNIVKLFLLLVILPPLIYLYVNVIKKST